MKKNYDIAIIGGGAAGISSAIACKRNDDKARVLVLEKKESLGKKLSITGNGRCNLSNVRCESLNQVIDFLSFAGVLVRKDEAGRLYPYSEDAKDFVATLTKTLEALNVEVCLNSQVTRVEADPRGGFLLFIDGKNEPIFAKKVLIATGGKSYGNLGSSGDGYIMAKALGHTVNTLSPVLTAVETKEDMSALKGVRAKVKVGLSYNGDVIFQEAGELQFRQDGISGICIMNMTRHIIGQKDEITGKFNPKTAFDGYEILVDFMPDVSENDLLNLMKQKFELLGRASQTFNADSCFNKECLSKLCVKILSTMVKPSLAIEISRRGILLEKDIPMPLASEDWEGLMKALIKILKGFSLRVKNLKGWNEAQVTKGGVDLKQVDLTTMESRLVKDLYFAGEVLDYDGPCGGYNLHHCWLTAMNAGKAMTNV